MFILGLTGSIGMGKSEAAKMFRALDVPVFDSDAAVHALLGPGGAAVAAVAGAFPDTEDGDHIDRARLGELVFEAPEKRRQLEGLLHPLVQDRQQQFLLAAGEAGEALVVLDIPLLYETGAEARCDAVAVVSAPEQVQRERVLARPGMTGDRLAAILAAQTPDAEKRRRADHIIPTGHGLEESRRAIERIVAETRQKAGRIFSG